MNLDLAGLNHVIRDLPNGGFVLVLDTGAKITPEAEAMLQALHSRSVGGIREHLSVLAKKGPDKFLNTYYVGYGHKSIGDCGSATVFVEGISMLVAKAIQDWRLYNGQESSTRYIPFGKQLFLNPAGTEEGTAIQERWRAFYLTNMEAVVSSLCERFPMTAGGGEKPEVYEKAIRARAFDTMRGFLPAGATTNVAWRMELRQFVDELLVLRHHPLEEARAVARVVEGALQEAFPNSFGQQKHEATEYYNEWVMRDQYYFSPEDLGEFWVSMDGLNYEKLWLLRAILQNRPPKTELPQFVAGAGTVEFEYLLDFGSFRDIQRHRSVVQRMPLLTAKYGFERWYLDELPDGVREAALALIDEQESACIRLELPKESVQYYMAMGYRVPCSLSGDLRALTYIIELRSTRFVHPTLRRRVAQMREALERILPPGCAVFHIDPEPDRFDVKRGTHDIVRQQV